MSSIFLSHSHADKPLARRLAADLRAAGHSVWIDEAEIEIGDSLIGKIREGLDQVEYVAALISSASVNSEWVNKELEIASNREIDEKRVVVLPLLIEKVDLPGFLKGKFYGDFTEEHKYEDSLQLLLRKFKPAKPVPQVEPEELESLREQLKSAIAQAEAHKAEAEAHRKIALQGKSKKLVEAIEKANQNFPSHAPINATYAFETCDTPVTLDYLLWAIAKAERRGGHPLEMLLTIDNKWGEVEAMLTAYSEMIESANRG
ncbi:MAG: toll/interleukin-1 receptor domain-containing protein [Gammaproteobacteria bacterium]|nr:toll/interleukin-1 receptor domain-containing protein [Gammaproteobacteria bacterium]